MYVYDYRTAKLLGWAGTRLEAAKLVHKDRASWHQPPTLAQCFAATRYRRNGSFPHMKRADTWRAWW